jgi:hypothetical protein
MGESGQLRDHADAQDTVRRVRDEMHSVTQSLRALLKDLSVDRDDAPRGAQSPGSAPSR